MLKETSKKNYKLLISIYNHNKTRYVILSIDQ